MTGLDAPPETTRRIPKPQPGEYPPYAGMYLDLLPDDGRLLQHLRDNLRTAVALVACLPEERLLHRYADGKWTIKEVLVHLIDDERVYAYRALCFARGETTPLPEITSPSSRTRIGTASWPLSFLISARSFSRVRQVQGISR